MVQRSAYSAQEIKDMIKSDDKDDQGVAARNLWSFWEGWKEDKKEEGFEHPDEQAREQFSEIAPRLHEFLLRDLDELSKAEGYSQPRHIWHYLLSLGTLQYLPALSTILDTLIDRNVVENVRGFAADALTRFPPGSLTHETVTKLWELGENDPSLPVRVNSIRAIAANYYASGDAAVAKKLWKLIETQENPAILTAMMLALGDIGSKSVVPDLVHTLITRRTGTMKKDAGLALDKIAELNGMSNRDALIKSMEDIEMS